MAHKTLTISEEAYKALARAKSKDESFTKVILRLTRKKAARNLLDYVRSFSPDEELASAVEKVLEKRGKISLRTPELYKGHGLPRHDVPRGPRKCKRRKERLAQGPRFI